MIISLNKIVSAAGIHVSVGLNLAVSIQVCVTWKNNLITILLRFSIFE